MKDNAGKRRDSRQRVQQQVVGDSSFEYLPVVRKQPTAGTLASCGLQLLRMSSRVKEAAACRERSM